MITLITGQPGAGKTAMAIDMLSKEAGNRPIFVMGVPELKIPHEQTPPVANWTELRPNPDDPSLKAPYFTFPPNSIILIDEAQNVYRPRATGSKVPDIVAAFETHRHTGVDFWLITQGPTLIDSNIRKLVGRHVHIRATALGRYKYEWPECGEPDSKTSRDQSAKSRYKLPKRIFGQYKSATMHLKTSKAMPVQFWVIVGVIPLLGFFGYRAYHSIHSKMTGDRPAVEAQQDNKGLQSTGKPPQTTPPTAGASVAQPVTASTIIQGEAPRLAGRPETAPMYDGMRAIKQMPMAVAYIANRHTCKAFTQQGTPIAMSEEQCRRELAEPRFNPYADQVTQVAQAQPQQTAPVTQQPQAVQQQTAPVMQPKQENKIEQGGQPKKA